MWTHARPSAGPIILLARSGDERADLGHLVGRGDDFSEFMELDVGEDGCFTGGTPLASCWSEPSRHPYVIRTGAHVAGFCILDERSRLTGATTTCDVAQFFVMRRYRRHGVGLRAAHLAFDVFRRPWEVRQTHANVAATAFWRRAIDRYTNGAFTETIVAESSFELLIPVHRDGIRILTIPYGLLREAWVDAWGDVERHASCRGCVERHESSRSMPSPGHRSKIAWHAIERADSLPKPTGPSGQQRNGAGACAAIYLALLGLA